MSKKILKLTDELCKKLNMELILYLPPKYKERVKKACTEIIFAKDDSESHVWDNNKINQGKIWKAQAYLYFLQNYHLYDLKKIGYNHIHCNIRSIKIKLSDYNQGKKFKVLHELKLKNDLASTKSGIDHFIQGDKKKRNITQKLQIS